MSSKKYRATCTPIPHPNPPTVVHGQYTSKQLRSIIDKEEFCIISNVLDPATVLARRDGLKKAYASIFDAKTNTSMGYDLDIPESLVNTPPYKGNGIVAAQKTAGLIDLVQLKLDGNISSVYEHYYSCTARDLATSNDRFGVMLPSNERSGLTAHIDANPNKEREALDEDMLQGFVVLNDSVDKTQGFVIYPGHAKNPGKWANPNCRGDFYLLSDEQKDQLGQGFIISPCAGSMVVWLSTAVHANNNGKGKKDTMGRMVAYVAKYPWSRISDSAANALENAIINKITLGHNTKRPSAQKTGNVRFGPNIDWQFGQEYLTNYNSREDIPELLRKP